jgi:hypothetical protein
MVHNSKINTIKSIYYAYSHCGKIFTLQKKIVSIMAAA